MLPRMKNIIIIFFCMFMLMFQATAQNHADVKEIEVSGIVFIRTAVEIKEIVEVCKENGIEVTGSVFKRTADEIKEIVK